MEAQKKSFIPSVIIRIVRTILPFILLKNNKYSIRDKIGIVQLCLLVIIGMIKSKNGDERV